MKAQTWWKTMFLSPLYLGLLVSSAMAGPQIVAKGLFAGRALLEINGEDRLIKVGEPTAEGVLLISSTSKEAVIEVSGVRQTLILNSQISAKFVDAPTTAVTIPRGEDSHYRVNGTIDGHAVEMMVDTGATAVVMNANEAKRLGIDYMKGRELQSATASGMVDSYLVDLHHVSVGNIEVRNIKGVVLKGDFPTQTLLGNTFLNHVVMEQQADALVLKRKY
jgi:aspartyl protease family protein